MKRAEFLDKVKQTVTGRQVDIHGAPENSFPLIADAWTQHLQARGLLKSGAELLPSDAAFMLADFKKARRRINPNNPDTVLDECGYLAIAAELQSNEKTQLDDQ